jgi:hypothetical protein
MNGGVIVLWALAIISLVVGFFVMPALRILFLILFVILGPFIFIFCVAAIVLLSG